MSVSNKDHAATSTAILENRPNPLDLSEQFHKMNVDCWEKIFEYSSLRDIFSMSKTCIRMRRICGYYLRENFPEIQCKWIENRGLYVGYPTCVKGDNLSDYMNKVTVIGYLERFLEAEDYHSLRTLLLRDMELTDTQMKNMKGVLKNVENIDLRGCSCDEDIHENFLKHCTQLKRLTINEHTFGLGGASRNFFGQSYSELERFEYIHGGTYSLVVSRLRPFLELNSNLKHFSIDMEQLWANRETFIESNIRLDILEIHSTSNWLLITPVDTFVGMLRSLHERGFFNKLYFNIIHSEEDDDYQELVNGIATLNALKVLRINEDVDLSKLVHLKELCLWGNVSNVELLATSLVNLERILFYKATTDDILPFFKHSKRLKTVRVFKLYGGLFLMRGALNLIALNEERKRLGSTRAVTICVEEDVYLATKMTNISTNLSLVKIARGESETLGSFDTCYVKF